MNMRMSMVTTFLSLFTQVINHALSLDPGSTFRLNKLHGKVIAFELLPFKWHFKCKFHHQGISLHVDDNLAYDTFLRGTPLQFLGVMIDQTNRHRFFADDLTIHGDMEIGQAVIALFDQLQIDWESQLAHLFGDIPAYHAANRIRAFNTWLKSVRHEWVLDIKDFIQEEMQILPRRESLQTFFTAVDCLRMDVDRMDSKLQNFKYHLETEIKL